MRTLLCLILLGFGVSANAADLTLTCRIFAGGVSGTVPATFFADANLVVDFAQSTVNGTHANISDGAMDWELMLDDGGGHAWVNRFTGSVVMHINKHPLVRFSGSCASAAQRQF